MSLQEKVQRQRHLIQWFKQQQEIAKSLYDEELAKIYQEHVDIER